MTSAWPPDSFEPERIQSDLSDFSFRHQADASLSDLFLAITKKLQERFEIDRGLLAIREIDTTHFLATSSFDGRKLRKNLSLRIPSDSSLFEKVAESRDVYTDEYFDLFSGNPFEKRVLMSESTRSYIIIPIKQAGEIVGLLGYSSETPMAFAALAAMPLEQITEQLARMITPLHAQVPQD